MRLHASCAAREGQGVLLIGRSGAGKSEMVLRLMDRGWSLVADDQVEIETGVASAPPALAGLLEIRGLGLLKCRFLERARLHLVVRLGQSERLPMPARYEILDLPLISVDPRPASAAILVGLALDGVQGKASFATGAFG